MPREHGCGVTREDCAAPDCLRVQVRFAFGRMVLNCHLRSAAACRWRTGSLPRPTTFARQTRLKLRSLSSNVRDSSLTESASAGEMTSLGIARAGILGD